MYKKSIAPPVIAFAGVSGSGKTGLLEKVTAELKRRGRKVAVIKHTHKNVETDIPGKDSWRLREAGADAVVLNSPTRHVLSVATERRARAEHLCTLLPDDTDIVLMEGLGHDKKCFPVVHVVGNGLSEKDMSGENVVAVIGPHSAAGGCPAFLPEQVSDIAGFLESRYIRGRGCTDNKEKP